MVRRRTTPAPTLEEAIRAATTRDAGARSHAEIVPPSGRHLVLATRSGTLTATDRGALIALAARHDVVFAEERAVGEYAVAGTPLYSWWSANEFIPSVPDELALDAAALDAATIGGEPRDVTSMLRAATLDELATGLCLLARLPDPPRAHMDEAGFWRLLAAEEDFTSTLRIALEPWLLSADPFVIARILLLLREVAFSATLPARRRAAARERDRLLRAAAAQPLDAEWRARLERLSTEVDDALDGRWSRRGTSVGPPP